MLSIFPLEFISHLTFLLRKKSFALDEHILREGDHTRELYFITNGKVSLVHRETYTFIADLYKDMSFGEIAFFSDAPR